MRRTLLVIGATAVLLVGGCGTTRPHAAPGPTVATVPLSSTSLATTPTTVKGTAPPATTTDPSTTLPPTTLVPTKITVAYVDEVLAKLNHVYGDALRDLVMTRTVSSNIVSALKAIYESPLYRTEVQIFREGLKDDGLSNIRLHPGDRKMDVIALVSASRACVFAKVKIDESSVDKTQVPASHAVYEGLKAKPSSQFRNTLNPTPWEFFFDLSTDAPERVADPCT
jgi:hypothetical protein